MQVRSPLKHRPVGLVIREVVMLLLIPSLLLSALLPAVQAAREAARRMQCGNNFRQLGLAAHGFLDTNTSLPAGVSFGLEPKVASPPPPGGEDRPLYGWAARLLPYAELYREYEGLRPFASDLNSAVNDVSARSILQRAIPVFRCPSDVESPWLNYGRPFGVDQGEVSVGLANYVASFGTQELTSSPQLSAADGVFVVHRGLRFGEISDGTSNTLMMGERAWKGRSSSGTARAAVWPGSRSGRGPSFTGLADVLATGAYRINFDAVTPRQPLSAAWQRQGFSSNHRGGAQFLYADGAVTFLPFDIDADMDPQTQRTRTPAIDSVFERLLCRFDGQTVEW